MKRKLSIMFLGITLLTSGIFTNSNISYAEENFGKTETIKNGKDGWQKVDQNSLDGLETSKEYSLKEDKENLKTEQNNQNTYSILDKYGKEVQTDVRSLFDAFGKMTDHGWSIKENFNLGRKIFSRTNLKDEFHCFQGIKYHKTVYNIQEAREWVENFSYSHVYDGTGILRMNSYKSISGEPDEFTLEPESGGYYYKFASPWAGGNSSSTKINLSKSKFKFSDEENKKNNAYIYKSIITNSQIVEFGAMTMKELGGKWVLFCRDETGFYVNKDKVISLSYFNGNDYEPIEDIEISISKDEGFAKATIKNSSGSFYEEYKLKAKSITEESNPFFVDAVSFVPDVVNRTGDLGNGAYLKNVEMMNPKLYSEKDKKGREIDFYGDSPSTAFAFLYNNDVANYVREENTETINIRYDLEYRNDRNK